MPRQLPKWQVVPLSLLIRRVPRPATSRPQVGLCVFHGIDVRVCSNIVSSGVKIHFHGGSSCSSSARVSRSPRAMTLYSQGLADLPHQRQLVAGLEGPSQRHDLVEHGAQRPAVGRRPVGLAGDELGAEVVGRAHERVGLETGFQQLGDAEVGQLHAPGAPRNSN